MVFLIHSFLLLPSISCHLQAYTCHACGLRKQIGSRLAYTDDGFRLLTSLCDQRRVKGGCKGHIDAGVPLPLFLTEYGKAHTT